MENFRVLKFSVSHEWENAMPVHTILKEVIHFKSVVLNLVHFGGHISSILHIGYLYYDP